MNTPIYIHSYAGICALGGNMNEIETALFSKQPPTAGTFSDNYASGINVFLGSIQQQYTDKKHLPKATPISMVSSNNVLIYQAFLLIQDRWKKLSQGIDSHRIGVILGSSNSGVAQAEYAMFSQKLNDRFPSDFRYEQQEYGNPALFLSWLLNTSGPCYTISTACSSSAKAFISGARLLEQNVCDLVIVGGADVVSHLTTLGFLSLEAVDGGRCQPFSSNRNGIHLGEAAALFVLSRTPSTLRLLGWGESSDAYHIAAPHPQGDGAAQSMREALRNANLTVDEIDYLNLHGTATQQNDAMEAQAVAQVFGNSTQLKVSSTKPLTGHTLGAAGAIEALFCCMALMQSPENDKKSLPIHWINNTFDPSLPTLNFVQNHNCYTSKLKYVMSNSFGFGGSNASLIFSKTDQ